jgi:hypothetical protein
MTIMSIAGEPESSESDSVEATPLGPGPARRSRLSRSPGWRTQPVRAEA